MPLETYRPKMGPTALLSNDKRVLRKSLWDNYDFTVIKVPMSRIPENRIETILASCNSLDSQSCYPQ